MHLPHGILLKSIARFRNPVRTPDYAFRLPAYPSDPWNRRIYLGLVTIVSAAANTEVTGDHFALACF
jgi:hypothetical protein